MFFKDFTPLLGSPNQIRAARIYPGGRNLDILIGKKTNPEPGWYYPEAWIFSPNPAINPGSKEIGEGETLIYDLEGNVYHWKDYIQRNKEILGDKQLNLCVKLLDSDCTLPKEFHFRESDVTNLRQYPLLQDFKGVIIKPEVWIRHPSAKDNPSPAYIGFNRKLTQESFFKLVFAGVEEMEKAMNSVLLDKKDSLYIPGATVHSLGRGLYFEVLAAGDLKVTLQNKFAGRNLSLFEQLDKLYTGGEADLYRALNFVNYTDSGNEVIKRSLKKSEDKTISPIIANNYFSADWLRVKPGEKLTLENSLPHILVTAEGTGEITSSNSNFSLQTNATSFEEFKKSNSCYALIVHNSTPDYFIENRGNSDLILLKAYSST